MTGGDSPLKKRSKTSIYVNSIKYHEFSPSSPSHHRRKTEFARILEELEEKGFQAVINLFRRCPWISRFIVLVTDDAPHTAATFRGTNCTIVSLRYYTHFLPHFLPLMDKPVLFVFCFLHMEEDFIWLDLLSYRYRRLVPFFPQNSAIIAKLNRATPTKRIIDTWRLLVRHFPPVHYIYIKGNDTPSIRAKAGDSRPFTTWNGIRATDVAHIDPRTVALTLNSHEYARVITSLKNDEGLISFKEPPMVLITLEKPKSLKKLMIYVTTDKVPLVLFRGLDADTLAGRFTIFNTHWSYNHPFGANNDTLESVCSQERHIGFLSGLTVPGFTSDSTFTEYHLWGVPMEVLHRILKSKYCSDRIKHIRWWRLSGHTNIPDLPENLADSLDAGDPFHYDCPKLQSLRMYELFHSKTECYRALPPIHAPSLRQVVIVALAGSEAPLCLSQINEVKHNLDVHLVRLGKLRYSQLEASKLLPEHIDPVPAVKISKMVIMGYNPIFLLEPTSRIEFPNLASLRLDISWLLLNNSSSKQLDFPASLYPRLAQLCLDVMYPLRELGNELSDDCTINVCLPSSTYLLSVSTLVKPKITVNGAASWGRYTGRHDVSLHYHIRFPSGPAEAGVLDPHVGCVPYVDWLLSGSRVREPLF